MANRRMFAQAVVMSDAFLDMPPTSRCLYFAFGVMADDDGFVSNPRSIMRQCGAGVDDFKLLAEKGYVIPFDSGIIVITHWRQNNRIRPDRYNETVFLVERSQLSFDADGKYAFSSGLNQVGIPSGIPTGIPMVDAGKVSIGKDRLGHGTDADKPPRARFSPPSVEDVAAYCSERNNDVDPQRFFDHYEANGWVQGRGKPIKNWKAAVRTWEGCEKQSKYRGQDDEFKSVH